MPNIVCFTNNKGGVGKTTCTLSIADALAREKLSVLVIDMDPQANSTRVLTGGNYVPDVTIANLLLSPESKALEVFQQALVTKTQVPGVHLLPSNLELDYVDHELRVSALTSPVMYLRRRLTYFANAYDFVLIDTPPSINLLTQNAMVAADGLIVPFQAGDPFGLSGAKRLLNEIETLKEPSLNPSLQVMGAVLTGFDGREIAHIMTETKITMIIAPMLARIPRSSSVQKGAFLNKTVLQADRTGNAAKEYVNLCEKIMTFFGVPSKRRKSKNRSEQHQAKAKGGE